MEPTPRDPSKQDDDDDRQAMDVASEPEDSRDEHREPNLPFWKSKRYHERAKTLQTVDPHARRHARESTTGIFPRDSHSGRNAREPLGFVSVGTYRFVTAVDPATRKHSESIPPPERVYVAIDADCGGPRGARIVSGFLRRRDSASPDAPLEVLVITGMDAKRCTSDHQLDAFVADRVERLRNESMYRKATIVLVPENICGFFCNRLERNFAPVPGCRIFHERNSNKPGVYMTAKKTEKSLALFDDMLRRSLIDFSTHWLSNGTDEGTGDKESAIRELLGDLARCCYDERGAFVGRIGHVPDVLANFASLCYFANEIENSEGYENYRR